MATTKKKEIAQTDYEIGGKMTRTIVMLGNDGGQLVVTELDNDVNVVSIIGGELLSGEVNGRAVNLDARRLWNLIHGVAELFGGTVLEPDLAKATEETLRDRIRDVLCENESRCLDDDIDREVVLRELVKALTGS